jgi:hypothetical protein
MIIMAIVENITSEDYTKLIVATEVKGKVVPCA